MPGPLPKRSDQRRRRNKPDGPEIAKISGAGHVKIPAEEKSWHISAKRWYRSLKKSGQNVFYEPSDWAYAQLACDLMSAELARDKPRAVMVSQILTMMDNLLTSEGARRRARIELIRAEQGHDDAGADVIDLSPEGLYG
ncbi:hypothetical protein [Corynebacterium flavescens]|uniref:phage terminase small subunit n=1 Tax=Corynebacterium flavescens TaxID=28028 RepID=UPI0026485C9C|nr:hypothetical protein [Corynebacterium flavescens]MDN6199363.1 hypothetical protein [Corynebacterium flavescens]MDN6226900.1 hypothetical protein [Corynebacterium flavescens]